MTGTVFNIQRFCLHDGKGIRTTVFLKGCPLRCLWCHNPESQSTETELFFYAERCSLCRRCLNGCVSRAVNDGRLFIDRSRCVRCGRCVELCLNRANELCGTRVEASSLLEEVKKDILFYENSGGGMTVSGGEPAAQPEFTLELLSLAQSAGIDRAIETSGYGRSAFFTEAHRLGTTFLYDLKAMNPVKHKLLTGADNSLILRNLEILFEAGAQIILRLPLIPGTNDTADDLLLLTAYLNANRGKYEYAEIMPYHELGNSKLLRLDREVTLSDTENGKRHKEAWLKMFALQNCPVRVSE